MSKWRDKDGSVWGELGAPYENWDFTLEVLENHRRPVSLPFRPRHNLLKFHFPVHLRLSEHLSNTCRPSHRTPPKAPCVVLQPPGQPTTALVCPPTATSRASYQLGPCFGAELPPLHRAKYISDPSLPLGTEDAPTEFCGSEGPQVDYPSLEGGAAEIETLGCEQPHRGSECGDDLSGAWSCWGQAGLGWGCLEAGCALSTPSLSPHRVWPCCSRHGLR